MAPPPQTIHLLISPNSDGRWRPHVYGCVLEGMLMRGSDEEAECHDVKMYVHPLRVYAIVDRSTREQIVSIRKP